MQHILSNRVERTEHTVNDLHGLIKTSLKGINKLKSYMNDITINNINDIAHTVNDMG